MSSTHLWLLLHNVTTIEQMGIARFRERENDAISRAHGYCNLLYAASLRESVKQC